MARGDIKAAITDRLAGGALDGRMLTHLSLLITQNRLVQPDSKARVNTVISILGDGRKSRSGPENSQ